MTIEKKHYIYETADDGYYALLKQYAEENKHIMTEAESLLWHMMQGKQLGCKFQRQHIIGHFIADFINLHHKLIVEVDGKYHLYKNQIISDEQRTAMLNEMGYTVVRFTNEEVLGNINNVAYQIKKIIKNMEVSYPHKETPQATPQSNNTPRNGRQTPSSSGGSGWASYGNADAWAVDAGCSGNPGPMEYQGVDLTTGERIFHFGPITGTNNIGEFLAIVHALALMDKQGIEKPIYSDSYNAILWVRNGKCKTKLELNENTRKTHELIRRAEYWLATHNANAYRIIKWETKAWGEIPADFGRKK